MSNLKEKAMALNSGKGIEFMEGRQKANIENLMNKVVTIRNFDFINGDDGEYAVFIIEQDNKNFYFGGSVITNSLKSLVDNKADVQAEGLPAKFEVRKSKKGRGYTAVVFYPEDKNDLPF